MDLYRKRAAVVKLRTMLGVSKRTACSVVPQPRSSQQFKRRPKARHGHRQIVWPRHIRSDTGSGLIAETQRRSLRWHTLHPARRTLGDRYAEGLHRRFFHSPDRAYIAPHDSDLLT